MPDRALVFTDVADSTLLVERLGDAAAAQVWASHDRRARGLLAAHGGREIDRSDGFFMLFDDQLDAARFAVEYHDMLDALELRARVGLHFGDVSLRENDPEDISRGAKRVEVEGLAKPLTARIMALAVPGQTLLSAAARVALGAALPENCELRPHGNYRMKGIQDPVAIFELGDRSASFIPPADADKAYRVVLIDDVWQPVRKIVHNLPAERDAFVGRRAELRMLAQRLQSGLRLVTVLGTGGTGKTRLVRRYGASWLGEWPGGIYFCDLSEARSPDGIVFAVAAALHVSPGKGDPVLQLGHAIAGHGRCLIIFDNFEQVVEHAAATLGQWLDRAGKASFLVTSRERLQLAGEQVMHLEPLPVADEAIELFTVRAKAQSPDFAVGPGNARAVAEVVRLLDGLPLAIELAAARTRVLAPAQLVEKLRDRFALLVTTRGAAARQATLKAAIDWSWELLGPSEREALAQCAVFEGGFTIAAAEAVIQLSSPGAPSVVDAVQALLDKSLLRTWLPVDAGREEPREPHFGMYLSINEYAAGKLRLGGPAAQQSVERRHGLHFASFGTDEAVERLFRPGGAARRRSLLLELDNLVAACRRAVARADAGVAAATYRAAWEVLEMQGPFALGLALGDLVLGLDTMSDSQRASTCIVQAFAARRIGQTAVAEARLQQALDLARRAEDRGVEAAALGNLGLLRYGQGDVESALAHYNDALAIQRARGNRREEASALGNLGNFHADQGSMDQGRAFYEAALAIQRDIGNRNSEGILLGNLGTLYNDQGRLEEARAYYEAALEINRASGSQRSEGITLGNLGNLHGDQGRLDEALAHYEAALALQQRVGSRKDEAIVLGHIGVVQQRQGHLAQARVSYQGALDIAREVDDPRTQGFVLGNFADLLASQERLDEAAEAFGLGEVLFREVGDRLELAKLLCKRGRTDLLRSDHAAAGAALAEAAELAAATGAGADSEVGHELATLRRALEPS